MTQSDKAPNWLTDIVPLPATRDVHPVIRARALAIYTDPVAAARQAEADNRVLALFRGTTGAVDLMSIGGDVFACANFNRVIDGKPLAHHLIDRRDFDTLLLLISGKTEKGWMVSREDTDMNGLPLLEYAQAQGWDEAVEYLERYGFVACADGRRPVDNHQTRVDRIAARVIEFGDLAELDFLKSALSLGADPDAMPRKNLSLLHLAALNLKTPMVQALIDAGADLQRRHVRGETTLQLMWWCRMPKPLSAGWRETVSVLRAAGADPSGFLLPEEMTDADLVQPMAGAPDNARMMDIALRAGVYDVYKRGLVQLGDGVYEELTAAKRMLSQPPLDLLCFSDRLDVAFDPVLWRGRPQEMRHAWQAIAEVAARPNRYRDDKPCSFTVVDFGLAYAEVEQGLLAARARPHLRLGGPRRR